MKTSNSFAVSFYLRKSRAANGQVPIYARITVDGNRVDFSVKQSIEQKHWCSKQGAAKGTRDDIKSLNFFLEQLRSGFISTYQELLIQRKPITAQIIKQTYIGTEEQTYTLKHIIEYHDRQMKDSLAWGTMKNYGATRQYLEKYVKLFFKSDDVLLSQITYKFIIDFEHFLRTRIPGTYVLCFWLVSS